jgi:hypothetical protein
MKYEQCSSFELTNLKFYIKEKNDEIIYKTDL